MSNKNLADLQLESLARLPFAQLQGQTISAVLLALGSNYQADYYLPHVRERLAELGQIALSSALKNPDITATAEQPKPDYINQSVYLALSKGMTLAQLQMFCKNLEDECARERAQKSKISSKPVAIARVSMDIDILMVKLKDQANSLSNNKNKWVIVAERLPLAEHERVGLKELQKKASVKT
ncbi:2-amino-4-hydroxy-6-hydroxymethyldihydropteridine diphosphokinase [Psychrobacter sp. AH5]|uniref:2-amino-4-hydroxy-6- hydroxymethyldihydropteridine diphosphokinase n=1 Tax=Psychrobacter sp. AH5 TaxID=2937433 RepID=UPI00333EC570